MRSTISASQAAAHGKASAGASLLVGNAGKSGARPGVRFPLYLCVAEHADGWYESNCGAAPVLQLATLGVRRPHMAGH